MAESKKQHVNLFLDAETWRQFRSWCVLRGTSASAVVQGLMQEHVRGQRDGVKRIMELEGKG